MKRHLYSRDSKKNIVVWYIEVLELPDHTATISIGYGLFAGKLTTHVETITEGKVFAGKNRTAFEQASKEADARYKSKLKEGYKACGLLGIVAQPGGLRFTYKGINYTHLGQALEMALPIYKTDNNENLKPMKCQPFVEGKMKYPAIAQPKINGIRCVLRKEVKDDGIFGKSEQIVLRSKEGLEYVIPHIIDFASKYLFKNTEIEDIAYDGELYIHGKKLNYIRASVPTRNDKGTLSNSANDCASISFYTFDLAIPDRSQVTRTTILEKDVFTALSNLTITTIPPIVLVNHIVVYSDKEFLEYVDTCIAAGYEGAILRDMNSCYRFGSRPTTIMKKKRASDGEFKILDVIMKNSSYFVKDEESGGNSTRTSILIIMKNDVNDETFEAVPEGDEEQRLEYLNNKDKYVGKMGTVRYYERSGVKNCPFHANFIVVRDYE